ncbi:hypothetical protein INT48_006392 [Thamnidium elegans]|uniref:Uncharacterized protein n=1 Tax=Thamnidium elegans TaxID=101142 RepID=A0A8H7VR45_9FUNG|nr:hypothetical protein INT48_006392 [Thamnidium elegans]
MSRERRTAELRTVRAKDRATAKELVLKFMIDEEENDLKKYVADTYQQS